jgi:hypothetical protein
MENLYIVHWGSAGSDDDGNAKAFCGVHGVYTSKSKALEGLVECKEQFYEEIVHNPDYDEEDRELAQVNCSIYGSEKEEYFELDYFIGDTPCELYITITEQ